MKPLVKRVGERLRNIRTEKGLSQGDIAKALKVHRSYISGIERGIRNPTIKNIERLAKVLKINPYKLLK